MTKKPNLADITKVTAGKTRTNGVSPFSELEISKVYPNPDQPRKQFDDIEELAATIKEHGLLQPITVVKKDDRYMIISGERRYKAHLHNESKTIKAYILDKTDEQIEELALIENIQRNDLTDYETAKGVVKLWESGRYAKKSDLAEKLGKKDSYISKAFSTLKLDTSIIEDIEQNNSDISLSVIDEIARVKDPVIQKEVYEKYNNKEITRDEIKDFKEPKKQKSLKEKIEEFETPIACNYVEENSPRGNDFEFKNTTLAFGIDKFILGQSANGIHSALLINTLKEIPNLQIIGNKDVVESFNSLLSKDKKYRIEIVEHTEQNKLTYEELLINFFILKNELKHLKTNEGISSTISWIKQLVHEGAMRKNEHFGKEANIIECEDNRGCKKFHEFNNLHEETIFDLLKENLELKKEIEELKNSSNKTDSILDEETIQLLDKEVSKIEVFKVQNIFHIIDGKNTYLDHDQSLNYFKNCKQKEFNISFIFESAIKVFKDEVISKLDNYFFNENEKILTSNKIETIKIIEICENSIYVEYIDSNVETVSYSKAKELIKNSTQKAIPYTMSSSSDKAYDFINKMPNRTQQNNSLVLKEKILRK